jgi:hypothetical protein
MTTEAETVRPEDLKPGDRVRVTVVADGYTDETLDVVLDNSYTPFGEWITFSALAHTTITRLPVDAVEAAFKVWDDAAPSDAGFLDAFRAGHAYALRAMEGGQ